MKKFKANLFIVGSAKCGTTFLSEYFNQHSECCMAGIKEPDFFSHDLIAQKGLFYNTQAIKEEEAYHNLFDQTKHYRYYVDASVSYLPYPEVARRIYEYNPDARIVILLRDPVERAYSHYKMDKRLGLVQEDFTTLIKNFSSTQSPQHCYHQYLELGLYCQQIVQYYRVFGRRQVFCLLHNMEMGKVIEGVSGFLNLNIEEFSLEKANASIDFNSSLLRKLYSQSKVRKLLKKIIPKDVLSLVRSKDVQLSSETQKWLKNFYKEDQRHLKSIMKDA